MSKMDVNNLKNKFIPFSLYLKMTQSTYNIPYLECNTLSYTVLLKSMVRILFLNFQKNFNPHVSLLMRQTVSNAQP